MEEAERVSSNVRGSGQREAGEGGGAAERERETRAGAATDVGTLTVRGPEPVRYVRRCH